MVGDCFRPALRSQAQQGAVPLLLKQSVANAGQFMSLAVPAPLLHMVEDKRLGVPRCDFLKADA